MVSASRFELKLVRHENSKKVLTYRVMRKSALVGFASAVVACGSAGQPAVQIEFTDPPEISGAPNPNVPLVATVAVATEPPSSIQIVLTDGGEHTFTVESSESALSHDIPILGLKPGRTYEVHISAIHETGSQSDWPEILSLDTPAAA